MMNLDIKKFFLLLGTLFFSIVILMLFALYKLKGNSDKLEVLTQERHNMISYSDLLRHGSDDLSKYARLYVVTADEKYKKIYYDILDIRDGEKERPLNYDHVYWDLLEPTRSLRHQLGAKQALSEILQTLPYDEYEYKRLEDAKNNSTELVNLEVEAFNAMVGLYRDSNNNYSHYADKNQTKAIALLHSVEYLKEKEKIMLPLDEFLEHLEARTSAQIKIIKSDIGCYTNISIIAIYLLILISILFFYTLVKKILNPILYLTERIYEFQTSRDSQSEDKIFYNDEIGYMSTQFYKMRDNIKDDIKILQTNDIKLKEYLFLIDKNIITSTSDLEGKFTSVSDAFCKVIGYTKEFLIDNNYTLVNSEDMDKETYEDLWETIKKDKVWRGEIKSRNKEGEYFWLQSSIYPIFNEEKEKIGYRAIQANITNTKKVAQLLKESQLLEEKNRDYLKLVDKNIIVSMTDVNGKITYASEAFSLICGYSQEELIGKSHSIVRHEDMSDELFDDMWESITLNRTWHGELKNKAKDGSFYWVDATIYPTFDENGEKTGYTAIRVNITDKKKIEDLLITDGLTGVYNRRHFKETLPKSINIAKRNNTYFSFLAIDIDYFKDYNDAYGHQMGDNALIQVAHALQNSLLRASDICFRLGGEEFALFFETSEREKAYQFADKIRRTIQELRIEHKNSKVDKYLTISLGLVTISSKENISAEQLYKEADAYLYKAKESGRNRVESNIT